MFKVVLSQPLHEAGMSILAEDSEVEVECCADRQRLEALLTQADGAILRTGGIDSALLARCAALKVITKPGVGYEMFDVAAASERGIPVIFCPAMNSRSVAEHTLALILAASKNLIKSVEEYRRGDYYIRNDYKSFELLGKTLAVFGFGNIGRLVAQYAAALGMKIAVYSPSADKKAVESLGYELYTDADDAISAADILTLHMPLTEETRGFISPRRLALMKPTAWLINAARGAIVDENALYEATKSHAIAGAALDLLDKDPPDGDNRLFWLDNVIITPHMAALTDECAAKVAVNAARGTLEILHGRHWPTVADAGVYEHSNWKDITQQGG